MNAAIDIGELKASRAEWQARHEVSVEGLRIGISSSFTSEPLAPYLYHQLNKTNAKCSDIHIAPYNQIFQSCLNPEAAFSGDVDVAIFLWRIEDIAPNALEAMLCDETSTAKNEIILIVEELLRAVKSFHSRNKISTIFAIPPLPYSPTLDAGSLAFGNLLLSCHREVVDVIEREIGRSNILRVDLGFLAAFAGMGAIHDWRKWYLYRQPYTENFWWKISESLGTTIGAAYLPRKKCIVIDCDNTIWGGVVGEDGISGLLLGDDFPGSAFRDFQRQIVLLAETGVFVAIASKNNVEDVWQVFDEHDGMVLRREHISVAKIGWGEKTESIMQIAESLNIGLDSVVFFDDSKIEIEKVSSALPLVTCIHVSEEPVELPQLLLQKRIFDQLRVTQEDRQRTSSYKAEIQRKELSTSTTPDAFKASLELVLKLGLARSAHISRVSQLINKTNQFNLTTKRRSEVETMALIDDPRYSVYVLDLKDRFGSYGIVGVAILRKDLDFVEIETFLLSCRALGRGVEQAFLSAIIQQVRISEKMKIRGVYLATLKNRVAETFYSDLGFVKISDSIFEAEIDTPFVLESSVSIESL